MSKIEKSIEVQAPVRAVYNQWTQFEEFPRFMEGIKRVEQMDDTHLHWSADIGGKDLEWDAEIVDQIPDQCISWRSTTGKRNVGTVRFEKLDENRTRVTVEMELEPEGAIENIGDAMGVPSRRVEGDLKRFKEFIESIGHETGAWREEVHGGRRSSRDDSARGGMAGMSGSSAASATHSGIGAGSGGAGTTRGMSSGTPGTGGPTGTTGGGMAGTGGASGGTGGIGGGSTSAGGLGGGTTGTGGAGGGMSSPRGGATSGSSTEGVLSDVGDRKPEGSGGTATGRTGEHKKRDV